MSDENMTESKGFERNNDSSSSQGQDERDKKIFSRRKACWYCVKKTDPDWRYSNSYIWLVNEFGKIGPARVSGVCSKHQRKLVETVGRARYIALIGPISNRLTQ